MPWQPPVWNNALPLRRQLPEGDWRVAIEEIVAKHGLAPCELEPYARGETIVWRAGHHVVKMTAPQFAYQIAAVGT
ncbi:MAG TPA: hypothetical protein VFQ61_01430 [Polyangiaceae bacterium]|nr:hypothetical protein [Polyangiaceae bacterium]